jgi:hypothetical protein
MFKIAVLDDWQDAARERRLVGPSGRAERTFSPDAFAGEDEAAAALADFDILLTMRECTAFPESLIRRPAQAAHDRHRGRIRRDAGRRRLLSAGRMGMQHVRGAAGAPCARARNSRSNC